MFALVVPGSVPTQLALVEGTSNTFSSALLSSPERYAKICLTITAPFADDTVGAAVYYRTSTGDQYLGSLTNASPSLISDTGWDIPGTLPAPSPVVVIAQVLPTLQLIELNATRTRDLRSEYGRKVALNLYHFIESFNCDVNQSQLQLALNRWLEKFQTKSKLDPNFVFKTD